MAGYAKASDALLECRPNVGQEILEFPVVQLTLSQRILPIGKSLQHSLILKISGE